MKYRDSRVEHEIKKIVSDIISNDLKKRVEFFSIPHIKLSKDLSHAKIYVSFFSSNHGSEFKKIQDATSFIRSRLAKQIRMNRVPEIEFVLDNAIKEGAELVNKINALDLGTSAYDEDEVDE